ncbi:chemotaxis protein CheD [Chitinimonas sp. PSY-7]|uniref:chemotaxis protein CheD n=1 Tax=Chitinimonas sp. PSY-7 TaxID=3459088 RepID=UPI00404037F5
MTFQIDIFLQPGEVYFGDRDTRIRTLLGSCVAVTWWHPGKKVGGMCHYLLPQRAKSNLRDLKNLDGRYAEEAFLLAMHYIHATGTLPADYQVKMFGGGQVLITETGKVQAVGERNIEFAKKWLADHGFRVSSEHLAGNGHRHIVFDVATGDVWVRFSPQH